METDRTEMPDLAEEKSEIVAELSSLYQQWATRVGVRDWDEIYARRYAPKA